MEFDLFDFMEYSALAVLTAVAVVLFFNQKKYRSTNGHYTVPDWNFLLKKWYAEYVVKKIKKEQSLSLHDLKNYSNEDLKLLESETSSDSQLIYGDDLCGNSILLKITRRRHRISEAWLIIRLESGEIYTLPNHPDTRITNSNTRNFESSGLKLICLRPYAKWRISFNGYLRYGKRNEYSDDFNQSELKYIRFNFIWTACSEPIHWPLDWSSKLMATALATEPWKDGQWRYMLSKPDSGGYDQFGSLYGQVFVNQATLTLNLPGVRERRWGPHKVAHLHRTGSLIGICYDGSIYVLGAYSSKVGLTHTQFGNLRKPDGHVYPIDWMDFHLSNFGETIDEIPKSRIIRFSANNKTYTTTVHFKRENEVVLLGGRPFDWKALNIPIELGLNGGPGSGIALLWYPYKSDVLPSDGPKINRYFYTEIAPSIDELTIPFNCREAQSLQISGGKGGSLAILHLILKEQSSIMKRNENDAHDLINRTPTKLKKSIRFEDTKPISKSDCDLSSRDFLETADDAYTNGKPKEIFTFPKFKLANGFVLSTSAFNLQLERNLNIWKNIDKLESLVYKKTEDNNTNAIKEQCDEIEQIISSMRLEQEIFDCVIKSLNDLNLIKENRLIKYLAVRSSTIEEDGAEASSAGQYSTILGVKTISEIGPAILKCWASLFSYQSVLYRHQNIQPIKSYIAIVIQEMIPADMAGVLFTCDPKNGNPAKIIITANFGLGESVVSGLSEPDTYYVQRDYNNSRLSIDEQILGSKNKIVSLNEHYNVDHVDLDVAYQTKFCLSDDQILKLSEIGIALEKIYCSPRDIEWAICDGEIYILQSRPVTSLNQITDWELLHEFDKAIMSVDDLHTTGNVGEVLPETTSPLTISTVCRFLDMGIQQLVFDDKPLTNLYQPMLAITQQHVIMNIYDLFFKFIDKEITVDKHIHSILVFGHKILTPEIHRIAIHRNEIISSVKKLQSLSIILKYLWYNKHYLKELTAIVEEINGRYSNKNKSMEHSTSKDLLNNLELTISNSAMNAFRVYGLISSSCVFAEMVLMSIMMENNKVVTTEHQIDMAQLLSSCNNLESADIPFKLNSIAKIIYNSSNFNEFIKIESNKCEEWLKINCVEAHEMFNEFIQKNFHRCFKELDLASITWGMNSKIVIEMLQNNLKNYNPQSENIKSQPSESTDTLINKLKTPKSFLTKFFLKKFLRVARNSVQSRETGKSLIISFIHELRMGFHNLSDSMFREGLLPNKDLIFFMTIEEISKIIKNRDSGLIKKAIRRQKLTPNWKLIKLPELIYGVSKDISSNESNKSYEINNFLTTNIIRGTPVSVGSCTGRACVVKSFLEIDQINAGDILITHSTDIGWSPYFPILSGVVTELGGLVSHGAVVAREYGLPCIVGVQGATSFVKTGDRVKIIGEEGILMKINE